PIYRDRYSIGAIVGRLEAGRPCRGLWHAIQAISRLAHAGCSAGGLTVTAFNGRLFAPAGSAACDRTRIADGPLSDASLAARAARGVGAQRRQKDDRVVLHAACADLLAGRSDSGAAR